MTPPQSLPLQAYDGGQVHSSLVPPLLYLVPLHGWGEGQRIGMEVRGIMILLYRKEVCVHSVKQQIYAYVICLCTYITTILPPT